MQAQYRYDHPDDIRVVPVFHCCFPEKQIFVRFEIEKKKILLEEPLKRLGNFVVPVKVYQDDKAAIKVVVSKEEGGPEAGPQEGEETG